MTDKTSAAMLPQRNDTEKQRRLRIKLIELTLDIGTMRRRQAELVAQIEAMTMAADGQQAADV